MKMEETPQHVGGMGCITWVLSRRRESAAANSKALEKDGQVTIIHKQMHYKVLTLCFWIINVNTMSDF